MMSTKLPRARKAGLVTRKLHDEVLVYDLDRHKASCLNRTAALVWEHCDGRTTVASLVARLRDAMEAEVDERAVWLALDRLDQAHLLEGDLPGSVVQKGSSRREWLRELGRLGVRAAVLPAVVTIVAPTVADAQTGGTIEPGICISKHTPPCPGTLCKGGGRCLEYAGGCKCQ
jgi:hypothetical protein